MARKSKDIAITTANSSKFKLTPQVDELWKYLQYNNQIVQAMVPRLQLGYDGYNSKSPNPVSKIQYELLCLREYMTYRTYYQQSLEAKKWNLQSNIQVLKNQISKLNTTLSDLNSQSNENDNKENPSQQRKSAKLGHIF